MILRILKGLLLLIVLVVAGLYVSALTIGGPTYASRYLRAFTHNPTEPPLSWYVPTEVVKGSPSPKLPTAAPAEEGIDPAALEAAAGYAASHNSRALIVARHGRVVLERYWQDGSPSMVFSSHSFHKSIVGMLVGVAIAEGSIPGVDVPASTWLKEWAGDARSAITIKDLLQMQSGLRPPDFAFAPWSVTMRTYITTDLVRENLALPLEGTPGKTWGHHNPDLIALATVLERATGQRYADYLSEKLWQPLGASDARVWLDREGGMAHTDCCYLTQVYDWMRVGEMLRQDGVFEGRRVLPEGWVTQMKTRAAGNPNFGFQMWLGSPYAARRIYSPVRPDAAPNLSSEPYVSDDVFFLDGFGKRRLWVVPSAGLVILREGRNPKDWDDSKIPNTILRGIKATLTDASPPAAPAAT